MLLTWLGERSEDEFNQTVLFIWLNMYRIRYFTLEKNEYYWGKDNISLEKITYRFFDDTQSMAAAYETGEVDVATALPSSVMELYDGKEDLFVTDQIATRYIYF